MKYTGSKRRVAKEILPIILKDRQLNQWYVEPFVGGGNLIENVSGHCIGADNNKYIIALLKYVQNNDLNKIEYINEEKYMHIKNNKDLYDDYIVGFAGFGLSFGAKFFGGFARGKKTSRDYFRGTLKGLKKQQEKIKHINFIHSDYKDLSIPDNSIIYCDPPYKGTTKYYKQKFNYEEFYEWCIKKHNEGHKVFISEYEMPENRFKSIWKKEIILTINNLQQPIKKVEKLFIIKEG